MKNENKIIIQPIPCRTCVWGCWRETIQYCSLPKCVKEKEGGDNSEIRPPDSRLTQT